MLTKNKTLFKGKITLAIERDDINGFRRTIKKLPAIFNKVGFVVEGVQIIDIISDKMRNSKMTEKFLKVIQEELDGFFADFILANYYSYSDINKSIRIYDELIENEERERVIITLLESKLDLLMSYEPPNFMLEMINLEMENTIRRIEHLTS